MAHHSSGAELAAIVFLLGFAALSAVDGLYLHLFRYRLHTRARSLREHQLHTGRAVLFVPLLLTVFANAGGIALWTGLAVLVLDQALELADTVVERESRKDLGGLSSGEYVLHVTLSTFRAAAIAFALVARPAAAWSLAGSLVVPELALLETIARQLLPGAVAVAVLHVVLAIRGARGVSITARSIYEEST